jgi:translocation and assembly module TamB
LTGDPTGPAEKAQRGGLRGLAAVHVGLAALALVAALSIGAVLAARFAVLTPWGRGVIVSMADGQSLGRWGRLGVSGLKGDVWRDFTLERVSIADRDGVWIEARKLRVRWRPGELLIRRVHAEKVDAASLTLVRRPELAPETTPPEPMPVSVRIDHASAPVFLLEGFSRTYGRWSAKGALDLKRKGPWRVLLDAESLSRPGDFARIDFADGERGRPMLLDVQAYEAGGGPIAGALGFSTAQPFTADIRARGRPGNALLTAVVRSGVFTPLTAAGVWNASGGKASANVVFAGSSLLEPYAARVGPSARIGLAARPVQGGRWAVGWALVADNLRGRGQGVVERDAMSSRDGVGVELESPSLTRLVGRPIAGPARFDGVLSGGLDTFRLKGQASLNRAGLEGYRLESVAGPLDVVYRKGRWDAAASARGAGGSGRGWLASLVGSRPTAEARLAFLPDGRVLLKSFDGKGAALTVTGEGAQNLLGGLSFQGRVAITNLAAVRRGASGSASGPIRASQGRPGEPWRVALDLRGRGLASGFAQADRLLGREPALKASGELSKNRIAVDSAVLTGAAGRVDGKGLVGLDGALRLTLAWRARGPFEAGPVELAGDASGDGSLTGSIAAPRADLRARFAQIDAGPLQLTRSNVALTFAKDARGYDGRIAVTGDSAWGPASGQSSFRFAGDGLSLGDLAVDAGGVKAKGSLALRRGSPSSADLTFAAGPGAFLSAGHAQGMLRLADGTQAAAAAIQLTGEDVAFRDEPWVFRSIRLSGQGTTARLPFTLSAELDGPSPVKFAGLGVWGRQGATQTVALDGSGQVRGAVFKTLKPLTLAFAGPNRSLDADLGFSGGTLTASARQTAGRLDARAKLAGVELDAVQRDMIGRIDGDLVLTGVDGRLGGSADLRLSGLRPRSGPKKLLVDGTLKAVLAGGRLRLAAQAADQGASMKASADLDLPVLASAAPLHLAVEKTRPLSGRYAIEGEVQPLWNLFLGGDRSLSGQVASHGDLSGTIDAPQVVGTATVDNGKFTDAATGLSLRNMTLDASLEGPSAVVRKFSAQDASKGEITGDGRIDLAKGGASDLTLQLKNFQLVDNDYVVGRASGPVKVTRDAAGKLALSGALEIEHADIRPKLPNTAGVVSMEVVEINAPPGRRRFETPEKGPGAALDVALRAPRGGVFLKGRGLNVEFALDAHVGGTTTDPTLGGEARVTRGDFNFAGQRFTFDERSVVHLSTKPEDIRLDLRAVRDNPSLTAVITARGTAARPEIEISSEPPLPQGEVLSQVLFGTSASQLSPVDAAQLGSALASLGGGGGLDVLGNLRQLAGLDRLVFASDVASGGFTVGAGKYISDKVYLELIGGGKAGEAVQVEWRVKKYLSIISRLGGQGDAKLAVRWRKDLK